MQLSAVQPLVFRSRSHDLCLHAPSQLVERTCRQPVAACSASYLLQHCRKEQFCPVHRARVIAQAQQGGLGDDDLDVAVFRFTLGIPGFDDRKIPRVLGIAIGILIAVNHVLSGLPTPDAQVRSELIAVVLAVLCYFVPDVEERLREALPGKGRQKTSDVIAGAANGFFLNTALPETCKKELAWASYALLKNTNCCGVVAFCGDQAVLARGALGSKTVTAGNADASLAAISKDLSSALKSPNLAEVGRGAVAQAWLPEKSNMSAVGTAGWTCLPEGAQSLLIQHIPVPSSPQPAFLLVFSERPRALTDRERGWVSATASKLGPFLTNLSP